MQSLAGALITGTHGTGARLGNLASGVEAMELVLADGSELTVDGGDELRAARVSLGALGVVAAVTLRCVPSFRLHAVDRPLPLDDVLDSLDEHVDGNDHFELFTFPHSPLALTRTNNRSDARADAAAAAARVAAGRGDGQPRVLAAQPRGPRACRGRSRAINRLAGRAASKRERVAESFDVFASPRLVRFEEMEYALPRARAAEAVRAARAILERHPVSFPIELRFSAGDDALLSPAHARDTRLRRRPRVRGHGVRGAVPRGRGRDARVGRAAALGQALVPGRRGARAALPALGRLRRDPQAAGS